MSLPKPYFKTDNIIIYHGDCLDILPQLPGDFFDSVITDPPYGLKFMGKNWDHGVPGVRFWEVIMGVCKPGCIMLAFGGTRTFHRLACNIEDAGWELRDCIMWLHGQGFPKSQNISKMLDKKAGTKEAQQWDGWGTGLKPAYEPIILAMKSLDGTYVNNALTHGVAGLSIDGGRLEMKGRKTGTKNPNAKSGSGNAYRGSDGKKQIEYDLQNKGRWPANVILDEEAGKMLDEQSGDRKSGSAIKNRPLKHYGGAIAGTIENWGGFNDSGGASRFFYTAKASKKERGEYNNHPTVKPIKLLQYLARLTKTPTGGIVLDPFMGSGSTALACIKEGRKFIGIEKEEEYCKIVVTRIKEELSQKEKVK